MFYWSTLIYAGRGFLCTQECTDQCALNSQPSTVVWQRVEMLGLTGCFSLSLSVALETRTSREGREVEGGARQGRKRPATDWQATPSVIVMFDLIFCLLLLLDTERESFLLFLYMHASEEKLLHFSNLPEELTFISLPIFSAEEEYFRCSP